MTHVEITFTNGATLNFDTRCEVNTHAINGNYMTFDDLFINLKNVLFIRTKEKQDEHPEV